MPTSSVAVRGLVLAVFGLGAASALAQGPNVTAFNPYSGVGLPGGPTPEYGPQAAYPIVDTVGLISGPAFNPWQSTGQPLGVPAAFNPASSGAFNPSEAPAYVYNPGAYLPAPLPGPIESRIVAIPERGDARIPRDLLYSGPVTPPPSAPAPAPAPARVEPPAPTPPPAVAAPTPILRGPGGPAGSGTPPVVTVTPAPSAPPPAATPAPPTRPMAAATPAPEPVTPPPAKGALAASIPFTGQSADLSDVAKSELDRIAKNIVDKSLRQIELRAYATGTDLESRKISLARALVVRSYLIDRGVKSRIEVGAFPGDGERVDILVPNT
jgi:outer membrane protein OmpA-like peptidoglycan-associated protein